jgi:RNA polymerase sigma-70 factor (ECF subfamily)
MEAENVTQETFLRVVSALERMRLDIPFKPYLFQVTVNLCRDLARKNHPVLFSDLSNAARREDGSDAAEASEAFEDGAAPLWEHVQEEELRSQLYAAIDALPFIYQAVITLRYVEEFSYEEIAQTLGLPLNTVRTHLRRAKNRLRLKLEQDSNPAPSRGFTRIQTVEGDAR